MLLKAKTVSISIACPPDQVYRFVSIPENLHKWAAGLGTPDGPMRVEFVAPNLFGVLDHYAYPAPGVAILNPMRVVPNGDGSEVMFTLFQSAEVSDEAFAADADAVANDLRTLKRVLEA